MIKFHNEYKWLIYKEGTLWVAREPKDLLEPVCTGFGYKPKKRMRHSFSYFHDALAFVIKETSRF